MQRGGCGCTQALVLARHCFAGTRSKQPYGLQPHIAQRRVSPVKAPLALLRHTTSTDSLELSALRPVQQRRNRFRHETIEFRGTFEHGVMAYVFHH